jgi:hypothetical protein
MTNLSRRLRKLEARLVGASGLIPHSEQWFDYWMGKVDDVIEGRSSDLSGMPLAVIDSLIERATQDEAARRTTSTTEDALIEPAAGATQ